MAKQIAVFTRPARRAGRRGEGLLVAVRRQAAYAAQLWATDASTLWVKVTPAAAADLPLLVGACYIPPATSKQLEHCSLEDSATPAWRNASLRRRRRARFCWEGFQRPGGHQRRGGPRPPRSAWGAPASAMRHRGAHALHGRRGRRRLRVAHVRALPNAPRPHRGVPGGAGVAAELPRRAAPARLGPPPARGPARSALGRPLPPAGHGHPPPPRPLGAVLGRGVL